MKTSTKQYEYFKKRCKHWQEVFGLKDYGLSYRLMDLEGETAAEIEIRTDDQHLAVVRLNKQFDKSWQWSNVALNEYAHHEICHLLLFDIKNLAKERYLMPEEINNAEHALIRRLSNAMVEQS